MLLAALAAAIATTEAPPATSRAEAHATVRIVRGAAIRFEKPDPALLPRPVERQLRGPDGALTRARLIEFE